MAVLSVVVENLAEFEVILGRGLRLHQHQVTWGEDAATTSMSYPITQIDWDAKACMIQAHCNDELIARAAGRMGVDVPTALLPAIDLLWLTYIAPQTGEV